ncbi:GDSL-type esterase/lipase family protein [Sandarakinorhabdus sp.]|uniref:GDSL-type esterase/lipase family protein n=1 Tax=Sandarakinorhabdus sp. TaxID=1916663 RepID=UPI003341EB23
MHVVFPRRRNATSLQRCALAALAAFTLVMAGTSLAAQEPAQEPAQEAAPAVDACKTVGQPAGRPGRVRPPADWAWLCRYRADNERLRSAGVRPKGVFIGSSIIQGWPAADPDFFARGRVGRGIAGQASAQILLRFQQDAIALQPRYIHVLTGTNDIAGNDGALDLKSLAGNVQMMIALAKQHDIKLFVGSILPADRIYWREQANVAARIQAANELLKGLVTREGAEFIDYTPALATDGGAMRPEFTVDGVHPNAAGYAAMKRVAAQHLPDMR